ncbi:hypothetical protein JKJ07_38670 [Actinoplanes sp. LDG1-01]|uniref:Uncharacterized protein n=1 Tax=Paractinoplanes lichenicola TaxID=2802976 RepID=A0ABS1W0H7_9ACTN|nr:hypothetical protein [Actinoplanes lichenicola]
MMVKKTLYGGLVASLTAGLLAAVAAPASPAFAICDGPKYRYTTTNKSLVLMPGSYKTAWADPGATVTYAKGKTTGWTVGGTFTAKAEAGIIFAKAETSLAISVTYSWSNTTTQTISQKVPKGKRQGRLRLYSDGYRYKVTKYQLKAPCNYVKIKSGWQTAPKKKADTSVVMEYRKKPPVGKAAADITPQAIPVG